MYSTIEIVKKSITEFDTDAIVNAANTHLAAGGGVCGVIFEAAGFNELTKACSRLGSCSTGDAVITPGFNLKARYIIHAVGPVWKGGKHGEQKLLFSAYIRSLALARKNGCRSITFPLISSGIYGYPADQAWETALIACRTFLTDDPKTEMHVYFAVIDDDKYNMGMQYLKIYGIKNSRKAIKSDWNTVPMPDENETFILERSFTDAQMRTLEKGNIPSEMEDKWFWYMEGNVLYAHRSWTGFCIYRIEFGKDGQNRVTVNRDPSQYGVYKIEDEKDRLNKLLDWWQQPYYDHYHEWLFETAEILKQKGRSFDTLAINGKKHKAVFFHKPEEPDGFLSNWHISGFDIEDKHFTSVEQYIMYRKCMVFGDEDAAEKVLATDDPSVQQAVGRTAKGYIGKVWDGMRQTVLMEGLLAKFTQNEDLKDKLMEMEDAFLVECAGSDSIWACGIRLHDDARRDASKWTGMNILGFALMEVRKMLRTDAS